MDTEPEDIPNEPVTADQLVAYNIRRWRRASGITQEELGARTGWSAANLSAAERSADPERERRRFDAQMIADFALALGVPLVALFLPPADDGIRVNYVLSARGAKYHMGDFMAMAVMIDSDDDSRVSEQYRDTFNAAAERYLGPEWAALAMRLVAGGMTSQQRADYAARMRERRDESLRQAREWEQMADLAERGDS